MSVESTGLSDIERPRTRVRRKAKPNIKPFFVSPADAARLINCSLSRLYELLRRNEIESCLDGALRQIPLQSLESYVERIRGAGARIGKVRNPPHPK